MKRRIMRKSQRIGRLTHSASTTSSAIWTSGISVSTFVLRICFGRSGKKGRISEIPAILNILPKFALVVMKIYLSVFAKVFLPSRIPASNTPRSCSSSTIEAALFAISLALSTEMPTSAA